MVAIGATLLLVAGGILDSETDSGAQRTDEYRLFLERGKTVFEEAPDRLVSMSIGQAGWATRVTGLLGAGVGVATTGARHVGTIGEQFGGIGEGGVGKIVGELGIPLGSRSRPERRGIRHSWSGGDGPFSKHRHRQQEAESESKDNQDEEIAENLGVDDENHPVRNQEAHQAGR